MPSQSEMLIQSLSDEDIDNLKKSPAVQASTEKTGSPLEAGGRGLLRGATVGLDRPALAAIQTAGYKMNESPLSEKRGLMDLFNDYLAQEKSQEEQLKKEHPFAYGAGDVASYVTPGASARLFKTAGRSAAKKLATPIAKSVAQGAAGVGAVEASKKAMDVTASGKTPTASELLSEMASVVPGATVAGALGPASTLVGKGIEGVAKKVVPELTGVPYDLLKKYATNPEVRKLIKQNFGKESEKATEVAASVENPPIPEYAEAIDLLTQAQKAGVRIDPTRIMEKLKGALETGPESPSQEAGVAELQKWHDKYVPAKIQKESVLVQVKPGGGLQAEGAKIPFGISSNLAQKVKEGTDFSFSTSGITPLAANRLKQLLQEKIPYGERGAEFIDQKLKDLAATLREDIEAKMGPEYIANMRTTSEKMNALSGVRDILGKKTDHWESRAEQILRAAYKNSEKMKALKEYDSQFETNFADEAMAMGMAREMGKSSGPVPAPTIFATHPTARSALGSGLSGGAGLATYLLSKDPTLASIIAGTGMIAQSPAAITAGLRYGVPAVKKAGPALQGLSSQVTESMLRKSALKKKLEEK